MYMSMGNIEVLCFEFECLAANLNAVHSTMEEDGGANWNSMCNAVFSVWCQLHRLQKELSAEVEQAFEKNYKQKAGE